MSSPSVRKPAVGFIFITVVLAIVGFGRLIPVLPRLIVQMRGNDEAAGSVTYGVIFSVYALMQFIGSPILGSLSDRYGRRRIILIATAGSAIDYVIMALAPSLVWFFIARMIAGFTAGVLATGNAYLADVTPPEKRAAAFGLIGAAFGVGFVIGPALGGYLGDINIRLPFWVAAGCSAANWLFGFFILPESLAPENRRDFSWARANPVGALAGLRRFPNVWALAGAFFILSIAQMMMFSSWALYTHYRFGWSQSEVGNSLMYVGVLSGLVQAVLVKRIVPHLGDTRAVIVGMALTIVTYFCYGFATSGWMIYVFMAVGSLAGISGPSLQSYITKHVPANEQGGVQGIFTGLTSLAGIPGPLLATWSFGLAIAPQATFHLPGIAFFEAAALVALALVLAARCFRRDATAPVVVVSPAG